MTNTPNNDSANPIVFAGCYTQPGEATHVSIFTYRLNMASGELVLESAVAGWENASYLAVSTDNHLMIAVDESVTFENQPGGGIAALSIDPMSGRLTLLNHQLSQGGLPCYISIDATCRVALVTNYLGGNVALFPILADGRLDPAADIVKHVGSSIHPNRQTKPFAHSVVIDPTNRFAVVCDLGIDKVIIYKIDYEIFKLVTHGHTDIKPGAGPRHLTFHPNGRWAYLINELDTYITVFKFDSDAGTLTTLQTVPTMPEDYVGENTSADIHVSPSGKFVYGSNRGHDSIAAFSINQETGLLTFVDRHSSGGVKPRNFVIDPTGAFLLAANQDSGDIVTFRLDQVTGKMTETGHVARLYRPVCLKFLN